MSVAGRYFTIPVDYAAELDGLRWSDSGDAIELRSGETFAFATQIWQFLEGFTATRPPLHFAHILHLMRMLGVGPIAAADGPVAELRRAYLLAGRPLRNAGVFCARVCHDLAGTSLPVTNDELRDELINNAGYSFSMSFDVLHPNSRRGDGPLEVPSLPSGAFDQRVRRALEGYTPEALLHWLKFGQAPHAAPAERLVEEVLARPTNVLDALHAAARDRERLAGALALAPALGGALSLPPRRLDTSDLPLGGYSDVTNRGEPERLLPTQFALDGDEFVRRFAERELLFFRREEPGKSAREELVVLLDQGVRTWGDVRLALAGAVFAFAKLAQRRRLAFRLATTSNLGVSLDPREVSTDDLSALLEAGDLTKNPEMALQKVLTEASNLSRDVVLLTHPRSLLGDNFAMAASPLPEGHRLFAASIDSDGRGRLDHLRAGRPVPLSRFRIDLHPPLAPTPRKPAADADAWTGDVEPIPFPFWFGPLRPIQHLAFDSHGKWLLVATTHGLLHLMSTDGERREVLPRGFYDGQLLSGVLAVLGTSSGFVVCGRTTAPSVSQPTHVAAFHYDVSRRHVRVHLLAPPEHHTSVWFSFPEFHAIAGRYGKSTWGIDLDSGASHSEQTPSADTELRACAAAVLAQRRHVSGPVAASVNAASDDSTYRIDSETGRVELHGPAASWTPSVPLSDGQPALQAATIGEVQITDGMAAIGFWKAGPHGRRLIVLRGPDAVVVREFVLPGTEPRFFLSDDGSLVAVQSGPQEVCVHVTTSGGSTVAIMSGGGVHTNLDAYFGSTAEQIVVEIGQLRHSFDWSTGELVHKSVGVTTGKRGRQHRAPSSPLTRYDAMRFHERDAGPLRLAVDRAGHVVIFDRDGERLLAMFAFRRHEAAAWLPDGTRWGAAGIGGWPTAHAASRVGRALKAGGI